MDRRTGVVGKPTQKEAQRKADRLAMRGAMMCMKNNALVCTKKTATGSKSGGARGATHKEEIARRRRKEATLEKLPETDFIDCVTSQVAPMRTSRCAVSGIAVNAITSSRGAAVTLSDEEFSRWGGRPVRRGLHAQANDERAMMSGQFCVGFAGLASRQI